MRAGLGALALAALSLGGAGASAAQAPRAPATSARPLAAAAAQIGLDVATLAKLGLSVSIVGASPLPHVRHPLSVVPPGAPWFDVTRSASARALVAGDGFRAFGAGALGFAGGFLIRDAAGTLDLSRLVLAPAGDGTVLELVDGDGVAWLATRSAQWELDRSRLLLHYLNADLVVLPALARRLGDARYAGMAVGVLALDAALAPGPLPPPPPAGATPPACDDWTGTIDVALLDMATVTQGGAGVVGGRSVVVVLPSANLTNVGTANVPWYSKFSHLDAAPFDQHPFLVWQMARALDGVFEPLGRSDLKHAFLTSNSGCTPGACTDPHVLGLGCSDVYNAFSNSYNPALAPRSEVTASTGIWAHCGGVPSHFDPDGDCIEDSVLGEDAFTHSLKAAEADLQPAAASYFVEAFYVVRGDVDIFNSMGFRRVAPSKPASVWTFPTVGAYRQGPAIDAWVNRAAPGPNADNRVLDTGQGHLQLAVRVSSVVGSPGRKRFAYALQNHDFDRRVRSFRVAFDTAAGTIENLGYADGDGVAANDWTAAVDAGGITWSAPAGPVAPPAELDYASVVSFRFDSDRGTAPATATLVPVEAGGDAELSIATLAPSTAAAPGDVFYTLPPCRLLDTRSAADGAAPIASGSERLLDVVGLTACGVPASAGAVALNVTVVGATGDGNLAVYAAGQPPTPGIVSFSAGSTRADNAVATLSAEGKLALRPTLANAGSTHAILDVTGYFGPP